MTLQRTWNFPFFSKFDKEIRGTELFQAAVLFFASRDGWYDNYDRTRLVLLAMAAYWIGLLIIMLRRNGNANSDDRAFLKWGFLITIVLTFALATMMRGG